MKIFKKQPLLSILITLIMMICVETTTHSSIIQTPLGYEIFPSFLEGSHNEFSLLEKTSTKSYFSDKQTLVKQAISLRPSPPLFRLIASFGMVIVQALADLAQTILSKLQAFLAHCVIGKYSYYFLRLNVLASQVHPPTRLSEHHPSYQVFAA